MKRDINFGYYPAVAAETSAHRRSPARRPIRIGRNPNMNTMSTNGTRRLLPALLAVLGVAVIAPAAVLSATDAKKPPPPPKTGETLTLAASTPQVVYGSATTLSGVVSTKQVGETITVGAQRYGETKLTSLATVTTTTGGTWTYAAKPTIGTSYQVHWKN